MIHKLCKRCFNDCKQTAAVIIARCPKYIKRLSESEFRNLLDDLDEVGEKADELKARSKKLVNVALEHQNSETDDRYADQETVDVDNMHVGDDKEDEEIQKSEL